MNEDIILNKEKFEVMIHYIVSECGSRGDFSKAVLYNLAYFSDFNYYELYEKPISGAKYIRKTYGPIPKIQFSYPKSLENPNLDLLSESEISTINDVIDKFSCMGAVEIIQYSQGDLPYRIAKNEEELDYEYVFYREPNYSVRQYSD